METKSLSFQLEETVPGTFALQGLLGGMISGFVLMFAIILYTERPDSDDTLVVTPLVMFVAGLLGALKATITWALHTFGGFQLRAGMRVALLINGLGLIAILLSQRTEFRNPEFAVWLLIALLSSLPGALFVGSGVKPWELFTFGSMAFKDDRVGSRSIWRTLATLPLRFLSILALGAWILTFASLRTKVVNVWEAAVIFGIPLLYLLYSAYVSFRSPRNVILLVTGIVINLPFVLMAVWGYGTYFTNPHAMEALLTAGTCSVFLIPWALFLIARVTLPTNHLVLESLLHELVTKGGEDGTHYCLGSRFLEWQQRVA